MMSLLSGRGKKSLLPGESWQRKKKPPAPTLKLSVRHPQPGNPVPVRSTLRAASSLPGLPVLYFSHRPRDLRGGGRPSPASQCFGSSAGGEGGESREGHLWDFGRVPAALPAPGAPDLQNWGWGLVAPTGQQLSACSPCAGESPSHQSTLQPGGVLHLPTAVLSQHLCSDPL